VGKVRPVVPSSDDQERRWLDGVGEANSLIVPTVSDKRWRAGGQKDKGNNRARRQAAACIQSQGSHSKDDQ